MSKEQVSYFIGIVCGFGVLAAFIYFFALPAWSAYSKAWERVTALFLSIYVLAALIVAGGAGGALIAYYWDRIAA